ncbi:MAG: TlpA family protein disulfide reductase [Bacteroidales bacterium]|nr:TlpA family protein disulfide reductase [Bacteroidales bacterium]
MNKSLGFLIIIVLLCVTPFSTTGKLSEVHKSPGIDITFSSKQMADTVWITAAPIPTDTTLFLKDYLNAIRSGRSVAYPVKDGKAHIPSDSVASVYNVLCDFYSLGALYMRPQDHISMEILSLSPINYQTKGSYLDKSIPHQEEFFALRSKLFKINRHKLTETELDSLSTRMRGLLDIIMSESDPETATRCASFLDDDFASYAFERLPKGSENSLYYTYVCALRNTAERADSQQRLLDKQLNESAIPAVSFRDLVGNTFDIDSFRGKWVVIDFWTTWCGPCRKGFEVMKKIYSEYCDKLEVIAIACGDQESTWRQTISDLNLPWNNYLAPSPESNNGTVAGFPVSGYPTKIIIDPNGIMREFSIGEDETFYAKLKNLLQ